MPRDVLRRLGNLVRELELDAWLRDHGLAPERLVETRDQLFELVAAEVGAVPVLYLEFGVAEGAATRAWSRLLTHPETVIHGFDSFEGLPERWMDRPPGMFSTHGLIPHIDDRRVHFFKGPFEEILPQYRPPDRPVLIVNMDADLYSSSAVVLRAIGSHLRRGAFLYFDEFSSYGHEERAFREFVEHTGMTFRLRGATANLLHVLFQCTSDLAGPAVASTADVLGYRTGGSPGRIL
jgi:Macrocin-O-methyltransferase (TylF)